MNLAAFTIPAGVVTHGAALTLPTAKQPLHRLAAVRRQQGVSLRTVARHLNCDVSQVKLQEQEDSDMLLSTLYQWQKVLDVPVAELLVDSEEPLSAPVMKRAKLLRLMKTVLAILERAQQPAIRRMARMMVDQLIDIMPELEHVTPWHAIGKRRSLNELGEAAQRRIPTTFFREMLE